MALGQLVLITGRGGPAWLTLISSLTTQLLHFITLISLCCLTLAGASTPGGGKTHHVQTVNLTALSLLVRCAELCALMRQGRNLKAGTYSIAKATSGRLSHVSSAFLYFLSG